ncbi:uncharacterized protein Z518_03177 [Rhinocladiella mackenziei CBS 650.93]|uniref:Fungal N-terminal domain-containing protein n=1 Tax=Rhinocladiella mackenziei CBS 650.93 TaxID=1442369 RepID=A0A0D2IYU8_9EURO|nr:uncharacterized protein Z518_03177 [Rhinocladiella mackenziei CBS 650.93]KIX08521.1 hypothetical protein Z518_03177 [Rhinocladiella mackenziei CBS 650.93]
MPTGVEFAAAVAGLFQLSIQLSGYCTKSYRSIRGAQKNAKQLRRSVSQFSYIIDLLYKTADDISSRNIAIAEDPQTIKHLNQIRKAISAEMSNIGMTFRRIEPLENPKATRLSRMRAKLMWMICDEKDLKELLAKLEPIKLSLLVLTGIFNTRILLSKWDEDRKNGKVISHEIPGQIKELRKQIKMFTQECKDNQRYYEAIRTVKITRTGTRNSFAKQTTQEQTLLNLIERTQVLAEEQIAISKAVMKELANGTVVSSSSDAAVSPSSRVPLGQEGLEQVEIHPTARDISAIPTTDPPTDPPVPELVVIPHSSNSQECTEANSVLPAQHEEPIEQPYMLVIHDNGKTVTEEWRRPRVLASISENSVSVLSDRRSDSGAPRD